MDRDEAAHLHWERLVQDDCDWQGIMRLESRTRMASVFGGSMALSESDFNACDCVGCFTEACNGDGLPSHAQGHIGGFRIALPEGATHILLGQDRHWLLDESPGQVYHLMATSLWPGVRVWHPGGRRFQSPSMPGG